MTCHFRNNAFLCLIWILIPCFSFQQIVLDSTDFAISGDTVRISEALPTISGYDLTGVNYSWDFSSLSPQSQKLKNYYSMASVPILVNFSYGAFAPSEYRASYYTESTDIPIDALNNFLPVNVDGLYAYTKTTSNEINSLGYSLMVDGQGVPFKSDTIETKYFLPLQFSHVDTSVGYTHIDLNPFSDIQFIQHRIRKTEVDGWGNIITPYGAFDVLRVKHNILETDSLYQSFVGSGSWIALPVSNIIEYEWWAKGEKEAILKIVANEINGNEVVQSVEYKDIYLGLDASFQEIESDEIKFYPNPIDEVVFFNSETPIKSVYIKSSEGKRVFYKDFSHKIKGQLDLSEFHPGVYFIIVETTKSTCIKRIIIN